MAQPQPELELVARSCPREPRLALGDGDGVGEQQRRPVRCLGDLCAARATADSRRATENGKDVSVHAREMKRREARAHTRRRWWEKRDTIVYAEALPSRLVLKRIDSSGVACDVRVISSCWLRNPV